MRLIVLCLYLRILIFVATAPFPPQLALQPPWNLSTNSRVLVLPHPTIPVPFSPFLQIPIDNAAAHAPPA
uniref:Secreted protein n=1 Tax=Phakopsora pachyrhizi TaxID=170000 RepID=A0A0S1MJU8_PHAPC